MDILESTQEQGIDFRINTNFTLLNKNDIERLLTFNKLASLTVSIWAAEAGLYAKLHNREIDTFYKVKDSLLSVNSLKPVGLEVRIFALVNILNYTALKSLLALAVETGCNAVEFGVADVIPGVTDLFLLNKEQINFIKQDFDDMVKKQYTKDSRIKIANKNLFLKRISNHRACFGEYDSSVYRIPCYAGWTFLRLRANGDFNSCLKSHHLPIGNIYKENFISVWNNFLQQEFRKKSLNIPKDSEYFRFMGNGNNGDIGCSRICDNILVNANLHGVIKYLHWILGAA